MRILKLLKERSEILRREIVALYLAYGDRRTPWFPKLLIILTVAYALSPVDLIPDFIPILGYLDDLVILPLLITLSIKLIPGEVLAEFTKLMLHPKICAICEICEKPLPIPDTG